MFVMKPFNSRPDKQNSSERIRFLRCCRQGVGGLERKIKQTPEEKKIAIHEAGQTISWMLEHAATPLIK
jgi:hypothetical protein